MLKKIKFVLFVLMFCSVLDIRAGEYKKTEYTASLFLNTNLYSSNFETIPGYKGFPSLTNASGFGSQITFGIEKNRLNKIFGLFSSYKLNVGFSSLSADYSQEYAYGNINYPDHSEVGYANHILNVSLNTIGVNASLGFDPISDLPIRFNLGFGLHVPISKTFEQKQEITSPSDRVWTETGTKIKNYASADIPNTSAVLTSILFSTSYTVYEDDNFLFKPEIKFNYGLNNLSQDLDWKINTIAFGLNVNLKSKLNQSVIPDPPSIEILPDPPAPPAPLAFKNSEFELQFINNNQITNKREFEAVIKEDVYLDYISFPSSIYFKQNSAEIESFYFESKEFNFKFDQRNIIPALAQNLKKMEKAKINLKIYKSENENQDIYNQRVNNLKQLFAQYNLNDLEITIENINLDKLVKREELKDEFRKIDFEIENSTLVNFVQEKQRTRQIDKNDLKIKTNFIYKSEDAKYTATVLINGIENTFDENGKEIDFSKIFENPLKDEDKILLVKENVFENSKNFEKSTNFKIKLNKSENKILNFYSQENGKTKSQFILGYFDFDSYKFESINEDILSKVKQALSDGKNVEIIALTDNIGKESRNTLLVEKRTNAALAKIGVNNDHIIINKDIKHFFTNDNPVGRQLNRSVIVRIY